MTDREYLLEAIMMSAKNITSPKDKPFAAIIVKDDQIISKQINSSTTKSDPTAHAEILAIRSACSLLNSKHLRGCTIYCSCEPCPMCMAALYFAKIERIVYAMENKTLQEYDLSNDFIYKDIALPIENRKLKTDYIYLPESVNVIKEWYNHNS